ncbi:molybdate-anion transporter-like isoform X2 [Amphiura filiformis]|uniref:molybdate-anion transporter-like isoform X2 n=1 Tax=Amphiura filiformis TaxID=82378 RepID=UPI003B21C14E
MAIFISSFWVLVVICCLLYFFTKSSNLKSEDGAFKKFQMVYLIVYALAMAADWLQGPYVYALYDSYNMSKSEIEQLFVAGFGASMVFGTIVGSFADKYGRKTNCLLYGLLYGLSCLTKHFNNFWILMLGRLLGGTATSILYSAFESWLVYEHNSRGFDKELLSSIFSNATLSNSIVAIIAGLVAQKFADHFGYVAPFDVSLTVLVIMCVMIVILWSQNYGDAQASMTDSYQSAVTYLKTDSKILCLGLIQSLFEGAMYTFVLEWTPALTPDKATPAEGGETGIPHGWIFAGFMVAIMIGSSLFTILCKLGKVESFMRSVLFVAAASLCVPAFIPENQSLVFISFLVFEVCVGIFWPSMGTMRGKYVPEQVRSTIMNFFRIPLNFIVILILLQDFPRVVIFRCCVGFLCASFVMQQILYKIECRAQEILLPVVQDRKLGQKC